MQGIYLANGHLLIEATIAGTFFPGASHVCLVYYAQRKTMLLAAMEDELFKSLHKTSLVMLKQKNAGGDKSISIQEVVIDNDIDPVSRELIFQLDPAMKIISIYF